MTDAVLCLNAGSSSVKFGLFELQGEGDPRAVVTGRIEGIGNRPHFVATGADRSLLGERHWDEGSSPSHEDLLGELLDWVEHHLGQDRLVAAGHRVVHGGSRFVEPVRVTDEILEALEALTPLAPLHQPHSLSPMRAIASLRPDLPQVACFDTAFHHTMPAVAKRLALPQGLAADGVQRYGFHGLSYEYIASTLGDLGKGRVVVAHLGNGASLCALSQGRSVDTTMGFTALDGLVMGTRCGTLDPGVVLYLLQQKRMSPDEVSDLLYHRSGLLGVSGVSADMNDLLGSAEPAAREAVALFAFRAARELGALTMSLGGLDGLVFTAGIGEHAAPVRAAICAHLSWLGVVLDADTNAKHADVISAADSRIVVRVVPTNEEAMIARHTIDVLHVARTEG